MRSWTAGLALFLLVLAPNSPSEAQWKDLSGSGTCDKCSIQARVLVEFGEADGDGMIAGQLRSLTRDARGNFWVTSHMSGELVKGFTPEGKFIRVLGREGEGPGEFRGAPFVTSARDSLYVFDSGNSRVNVFNLAGEFVRSANGPRGAVYGFEVLEDGTFAMSSLVRSRDRVGLPLHLYDAEGTPTTSIGAVEPVAYRVPDMDVRRMALSGDGGIWLVHRNRPVVELWSPDGKMKLGFQRDVDWFKPHLESGSPGPDQPPYPIGTAVWEGPGGLVWAAYLVADEDWKSAVGPGRLFQGRRGGMTIRDYRKYYDTVIDVIDPALGKVVFSQRLDPGLVLAAAPGIMSEIGSEDKGNPIIRVWELSLVQPPHSVDLIPRRRNP